MLSQVREALSPAAERPTTAAGRSESSLSPDVVFDILKNSRRRATLTYLKEQGTGIQVSLDELATMVAADEQDCTPDALTAAQRKRVYTALRQSHLPKLAEANVIEYDAARSQIALTDQATVCTRYLESTGQGFRWSVYYFGLGTVSTALLGSVWIGAIPATVLPSLGWAGCITGAFTVSALVHIVVQQSATHP